VKTASFFLLFLSNIICDEYFYLIQNHKNSELKLLISKDPGIANTQNDQSFSPLIYAAFCQNREAVKIIAEHKKDLDVFEACASGNLSRLKKFIGEEKGSPDSFSKDGFSLLELCKFFGQMDLVKYLANKGASINLPAKNNMKVAPIHSAVATGNHELTEFLLKKGTDPTLSRQQKIVPLHSAAHQGNEELEILLIQYGADPWANSSDGKTTLDYAIEYGNKEHINFITT
jgi:ankyrin repeat protein